MTNHDRIKTRYRSFAENECRGYSNLYFTLSHAVADDDGLVDFIAEMPAVQPNLFLASIQFLTGPENMPASPAELKALVQDRREDISRLMRSRRPQTNEVGRCAVILPALPRGRLALLEVGASAGLCLLLDKYFYDYGVCQLGNASSRVRLQCGVKGSFPPPHEMPQIVWRGGLDLSPIDLKSERDVQWLLSCVFADHPRRRERLAAAIQFAQTQALSVRRGHLVSDLPALLAEVPRDADLVVFHSAVLVYVSEEDRLAFANSLAEASRGRSIVWISNEGPTVVPEITALARDVRPPKFLLGRTSFTDGDRQDELLALGHPHGAELDWVG